MFLRIVVRDGDLCIGDACIRVEHAEFETSPEKPFHRCIDEGFAHKVPADCNAEAVVRDTAIEVRAGQEGPRRCLRGSLINVVKRIEVHDGPTI